MTLDIEFGRGRIDAEGLSDELLNGDQPIGEPNGDVYEAYSELKNLVHDRVLIPLPTILTGRSRLGQPTMGVYEKPHFIRLAVDEEDPLELQPDLSDWPYNAEQEQVYKGKLVLTWYRKPTFWDFFRYAVFWLFRWRMFWSTKCIVNDAVVRLKFGPPGWQAIEGTIDPFTMSPSFPGCEAEVTGELSARSPLTNGGDDQPESAVYTITGLTLHATLT